MILPPQHGRLPMNTPLRLGILSTARIAHGFVSALQASSRVQVVAVASRNPEQAQAFAATHGLPRVHASYDELLADAEIDAIYNPLPNSLHAAWTERALQAGKHVLCEKPLTLTLAEALPLFQLARARQRVLLEAFPYRYQPQPQCLRSLIQAGAIGDVRLVQASFGFCITDPHNVRFDASLGGGALLDAGCYAASLARLAVGAAPVSALAQARWGDTGVDLALTGTVHYASGAVAQIACSMDTAVHRQALVVGSLGSLQTDYLNHTSDTQPGYLNYRRGSGWDAPTESRPYARGNGFVFEAEHFADLISGQASDGGDALLSLQNMATLEALLRSAREGRVMPIEAPAAF
jgi:D-xylose 1-dehydrogenase (NADP+, D-xylono-1,5-lactone-forming)